MNRSILVEVDAKQEVVGATLVFRCQNPSDQAALRKFLELDRPAAQATVRWRDGNHLIIERNMKPAAATPSAPAAKPDAGGTTDPAAAADAIAKEKARLMALPPKELRTLAGENGVAWDSKASTETMVERIMEAVAKASAAK